jgi:hypothetical protein
MGRRTALQRWDRSFAFWGAWRGPSHSPKSGGEPSPGPILVLLLSLGLWALIWAVVWAAVTPA